MAGTTGALSVCGSRGWAKVKLSSSLTLSEHRYLATGWESRLSLPRGTGRYLFFPLRRCRHILATSHCDGAELQHLLTVTPLTYPPLCLHIVDGKGKCVSERRCHCCVIRAVHLSSSFSSIPSVPSSLPPHSSSSYSSSSSLSSFSTKNKSAADWDRAVGGGKGQQDGKEGQTQSVQHALGRLPSPPRLRLKADERRVVGGVALAALDSRRPSLRKEVRAFLEKLDGLPLAGDLGRYLDEWVKQISVYDLTVAIKELSASGNWKRAWQVFDWMSSHDKLRPDVHVYTLMISILGKSDSTLRYATSLFDSMETEGCKRNVYAYNVLLNAYAKHGRRQDAFELFAKMKACGVQADVVTYTAMVSAVASGVSEAVRRRESKGSSAGKRDGGGEENAGESMGVNRQLRESEREGVRQVKALFAEMKEEGIVADLAMYSSLMKAFVRCGDPRAAILVLDLMKARGSQPTLMMYNQLLDAYGKSQAFDAMEALAGAIEREEGCQLSLVSYNTMMDAYSRVQRIEDVERVKKRMCDAGYKPNDVTYAILLGAYGRKGMFRKAARTMDAMREEGYRPHGIAYLGLIDAYCKKGAVKQAMAEFERMKREGVRPTVEVITMLMDAYGRAGKVEEMEKLWTEMSRQGCKPTRVTFCVLLSAFSKLGMHVRARGVLASMGQSGMAPSTLEYNMLVNAYAQVKRMDMAAGVLEEMRKKKIDPDAVTFTTLIFMYIKARFFVKAEKIYAQMCAAGAQPDAATEKKMRVVLDAQMRRAKWLNQLAAKGQEKVWVQPTIRRQVIPPGKNRAHMKGPRVNDNNVSGRSRSSSVGGRPEMGTRRSTQRQHTFTDHSRSKRPGIDD